MTQRASSVLTPAAVLSTTGQTPAKASKNSTERSPTPKTTTTTGIHDSGEIMRRNWNAGDSALSTARAAPTSNPSGTPTVSAMPRPTSTRRMLTHVCTRKSCCCSKAARLANVAVGLKRCAIRPPS